MSDASFSIGHDGTRFILTSTIDGTVRTARLAPGAHTDQENDAAVAALRQAYSTLRQWATDAATANTNWPTMTAVQKDATTRETIRRLGMFMDRFGDLLLAMNADA